jgi:hypothetical protein
VQGTPVNFIRWGTDGLAFNTQPQQGGSGTGAVYLVSGGFVMDSNVAGRSVPIENVRFARKLPHKMERKKLLPSGAAAN